ncbi:MAG: FAD-dependent oxidoreductase [Actinobacteria bacterium]|nr:FAD-dependent oxidoreductase [Actinomycetota bacterium]
MRRYDLVVIGGGTAGLTAAIGAAGVGARVVLAERDRTGGECLWTGCVPSKALIATARRAHDMRTAHEVGLRPAEPVVDLPSVMRHVHRAIQTIQPHDSPERLRAEGVEVRQGHARFVAPGRVSIGDDEVAYRTALVATGSAPTLPGIPGLIDAEPLTTDTLWQLDAVPERLAIVGGGAVGCELGQAFARLGSTVSIIEIADQLLPTEDPRVGAVVAEALERDGVSVHTSARVGEVASGHLQFEGDAGSATVEFDRILVATGRRARTHELDLERVGVEVAPDGSVRVDRSLRTTSPHVFAAGDVTGLLPFTHAAGLQGGLVVTNALFRLRRRFDPDIVPRVVFTDPEVAAVGLSAARARRRWGDRIRVARFGYDQLDRAITAARPFGFAEIVTDARGRVVGATVVGESAGESIAELTAWIRTGSRLRHVAASTHAYPTFGEGPWRAALEDLRERFLSPRVRAVTRPLLWLLRRVDRPR